MLSILRRGTVEAGNTTWEFHGDSENDNLFYITPLPTFVLGDNNLPKIQIVEFETSGPDNGSGYCQLEVQLSVPDNAIAPIKAKIKTLFNIDSPIFETLAVQSGTIVNITYPDGTGGTTGMQVDGTDFGSNVAIIQIPLDVDQMKDIKSTMAATGGSPFQIEYVMSVPSFMPAVTAELNFDASIAYNYQVTAHEHTHWASSSTYTYDISASLSQSNAAKITVDKVDPSVPDSVIDAVRTWGQTVIEARVAEEVEKAIALRQSGTGTQSFSVSEIASFTESYDQNETIIWRLRPQSVLPSFADLGLTQTQIDSLEPTIDKRRFIVHVTPNANFVGDNAITPNAGINKGENPYMDHIIPLTKLEVTVRYPTLTSSTQKTFTFTGNDAHTWEGDWDDTVGGVFSLDYTATYNNGQVVSGSKEKLDVTMYTLDLADIGTINVTFNATKFFVQSEQQAVVDSLTVDFSFEIPQSPPFLQTFHLDKDNPMHTVTNLFAAPATTEYAYTLTYNFKPDVDANPFTSNVKRQNSQMVLVDAPDFKRSVPILAMMGTATNPVFLQLDIDIYYDDEPYFPDIPASSALPRPTQSSPIQFSIPARTGTEPGLVSEQFTIFANSSVSPLLLSAQGITGDGSTVTWGPVDFDAVTAPNLPFFGTKLFTFFEIDSTIVDWKIDSQGGAGLKAINLQVTAAHYNTQTGDSDSIKLPGTTVPIAWDPQVKKAPAAFYFVNGFPNGYSDVSFDWEATYFYSDATKGASGTQKGTILTLPKEATDTPLTNGKSGQADEDSATY